LLFRTIFIEYFTVGITLLKIFYKDGSKEQISSIEDLL